MTSPDATCFSMGCLGLVACAPVSRSVGGSSEVEWERVERIHFISENMEHRRLHLFLFLFFNAMFVSLQSREGE